MQSTTIAKKVIDSSGIQKCSKSGLYLDVDWINLLV